MLGNRSRGPWVVSENWPWIALMAVVLMSVPMALRAQEDPAPKALPAAPPQGAAPAPGVRPPGETCSVSPTGTILAGKPDETQGGMTNRWTKRALNVAFLDGDDPWNL